MSILPALLALSVIRLPQHVPQPVPEAAAIKVAEGLVRDIFKDDYAKRAPADQALLARKLLQQASETKDDPPALYVLLRDAHDRATQGGDSRTSMDALDRLAAAFVVNRLAMKQTAAGTLGRFAKTPDEFKAAARLFLDLADEAAAADAFDAADKALDSAVAYGKSAKDFPTVGRAEAKRRELKDLKVAVESLKRARATLVSTPEDPLANETLGRYECLRRNNWTVGLPFLAKSADAALKDLAAKDLATPQEASARIVLGDAWWDRAEKETGEARTSLRGRAAHWYRLALPSLAGLTRAKVEKRLAELPAAAAPPPIDGLVAWWKFDEAGGTTVADSSGGGQAATLVGGPKWGAGKNGGALEFDGIDDWVSIPDSPRLRTLQKSSHTLCAWFKPAGVPPGTGAANNANYAIVTKTGFTNGIVYTSGGTFSLQHWIQGDRSVFVFSERVVPPSAWYHVAGVVDIPRGALKIYVDGRLEGSILFPAGTPTRDFGPETWKIGIARPGAADWRWQAHGTIDDVQLFSRALADEEIHSLFTKP